MKQLIRKFHKGIAAIIIASSVFLFGILSHVSGLLDYVEFKLYDIRVRTFASSSKPSEDIAVILLDQNSIDWASREKGWGWPWPREAYSEIINFLDLGGAKSLAFDVIFSEASLYRNSGRYETPYGFAMSDMNDDEIFAKASEDFGRTVQIVVFSSQTGSEENWPENLDKPLFSLNNFENIISEYEKLNQNTEKTGQIKALFPVKELQNSAAIIGNVTGWPDSDGVFRRNNLFSVFDGKAVPGLSSASMIAGGQNTEIFFNEKKKQIEWGEYIIPVDKNGRSILNFRGSLNRYHPYWAGDLLKSAEDLRNGKEALLYPEDFKDRYVFFGFYAQGLFDICTNPVESVYPGVGMHITMLDNILQQDFIKKSPFAADLFIILLPVILVVSLVLFSRHIKITIPLAILVFALIIVFCFGAYRAAGIWLPFATPLICSLLALISSTLYSYTTEGSQKRFIKEAFSRYLAPSVIEQIIADPSKLNLGGEKREMTAIFTDIQRFSSISEALQNEYEEEGPRVLVNLLNLYLTEMSNIILENNGTVDKYEGDAIIAFFGAPVFTPVHASLACRSAILMKKREKELVEKIMDPESNFKIPLEKLIKQGILRSERPLYTRFGINTGDMVVGNMGTPDKMNYTIMGNAVNLSARLEGVNKQYDTYGILISEYTKEKTGDEFICRSLSKVRVVGINKPLRLYELLDFRENAAGESGEKINEKLKSWERAFEFYENKRFRNAANIFSAICENDKTDGAAKLYLARCRSFLEGKTLPEDFPIDNLMEK